MALALIPARGGSKGVPGKNIRPLLGHPLIAYSIAAARVAAGVERVIVSTDSEAIAEICRRYGAEVPFLRPAAFARDDSPDRDFVLHALGWLREEDAAPLPEFVIHLRPTTPLRDPAHITQAIKAIQARPDATSLRSSHEAPESPMKWFRCGADEFYKPMVGESLAATNLPRQAFETAYIPNGYVDVLRTSYVLDADSIHGPRILRFLSPACREVDTPVDFEYLEFEATRTASGLRRYLDETIARGMK